MGRALQVKHISRAVDIFTSLMLTLLHSYLLYCTNQEIRHCLTLHRSCVLIHTTGRSLHTDTQTATTKSSTSQGVAGVSHDFVFTKDLPVLSKSRSDSEMVNYTCARVQK